MICRVTTCTHRSQGVMQRNLKLLEEHKVYTLKKFFVLKQTAYKAFPAKYMVKITP
jgi:hypothetical protein